jgi:hypothetical protein
MKKGVMFCTGLILFLIPFLNPTAQEGLLWVDKFSQPAIINNVPEGWTLKEKEGNPDIKMEKSGKGFILRLRSENSSFGLNKELDFDLKEYPYLNWKWKAAHLPEKGDFLKNETDDQAGQVYVLFPRFPSQLNTEIIGYLWESGAKNKGKEGESPAWSKSKVLVVQAGSDKLNRWVTEKRNVYEDYKRLFGKEPPRVGGLSLYVNSQHTMGRADISYGPIFFSKN